MKNNNVKASSRHKIENPIVKFNKRFKIIRLIISLLIAFLISFLIIIIFSETPFKTMTYLFIGPLTSVRRFSTVLERMIPLTFSGLAVSIIFKANLFNLATEGAMFIGALVASICAIFLPGPPLFILFASMLAGGLVGSLIVLFPGFLKVKWNVSELVVSLMLNSILLYAGTFIFNTFIRDKDSAYAASYPFKEGVNLSQLVKKTNLHYGIIIALIFVVVGYILIYKTTWGYKLRVTGNNLKFSKTSGIATTSILLSSQAVGGFVGGVGGSVEMLGMYTRFQWMSLPGYGFDGVIINILAKGNPVFVPVAAFFISYIRIGAEYMYRQSDVASEIVAIIEGTIIMLVAAEAFLSVFQHRMTTKISLRNSEKNTNELSIEEGL